MNRAIKRLPVLSALVVATLLAAPLGAQVAPGKTGTVDGVAYNGLIAGQVLKPTESIRLPNNTGSLKYNANGELVLYKNGVRVWGTGKTTTIPGRAEMQSDGNFVTYDAKNVPNWATGTGGKPGAFVAIQDDLNVVIYNSSMQRLWDRTKGLYPPPTPTPTPTPTPPPPGVPITGTVPNTTVRYTGILGPYTMARGWSLKSPNGNYELILSYEGFHFKKFGSPVWTYPAPPSKSLTKGTFSGGDLLVYYINSGFEVPLTIKSNTGDGSAILVVQDDGKAVIYTRDWRAVWTKP